MKFEMIIHDDLFTFRPLDDASATWMRKSTYANGGSAFSTKKLYLRDRVLKAIKEAGGECRSRRSNAAGASASE
jgi:hypothetical protein